MAHRHAHSAAGRHRSRLVAVLGISLTILVAEIVVGLLSNSLALLADAGHVLADVIGTALALVAIWLAARPVTSGRTYGFYRFEILAAVLNAVLLFVIAGFVLIEAWRRVSAPPDVATGPMLLVAAAALVGNGVAAGLLRPGQAESLNMRGAYLEVLNDALGALAVLVAGLVMRFTGFLQADAIASGFIGLLILPRTWSLLREAVDVLVEATPKGVVMEHVRQHVLETPGVVGVHDLHVWTITSGMNVISAHIAVHDGADRDNVLHELAHCLSSDFDIEHSTFQIEASDHVDHELGAHT